MVGFALSALFFPMGVGLIEDITMKFIVLAALAAVGAALVVLLILSKKQQKVSKANKTNI